MNSKWLGIGLMLLIGGCASVEEATYKVTSYPEVALDEGAKIKFVTNNEALAPLVYALEVQFEKSGTFKVVDDKADYWFVLDGLEDYAVGAPHIKFSLQQQNTGNGGEDVIAETPINLASAAKNVAVTVYKTRNLAPVHYFTVPLYTGDNSAGGEKSRQQYAKMFSQDTVERIMDVFLKQKKEIKTPIPLKADEELRACFKEGKYREFLARYGRIGVIDLNKYFAAVRNIEQGVASDAEKELVKDLEFRYANYYLYLLVRESLRSDDLEVLEKTQEEHLRILETCKEDGISKSCPVALQRLEYGITNLDK